MQDVTRRQREREREREREQQPRDRMETTGTHRQQTDSQPQTILGRQTIWKRMELLGIRPTCSRAEWWRSHTHTHTHTPTLDGQLTESGQNCVEKDETHIPQKNVRRKMLMGSFGSTDGTEKSKFNKEKWLPLVYTPFKISHYCCNVMKKSPIGVYQRYTKRYPIVGTMTEESRMRKQAWLRHGCNAFNSKKKVSSPMSFWTEQDVLQYIKTFDIDICSVYGEIEKLDNNKLHCTGCQRTGCVFCGFGCHLEKGADRRFLRLKETHPKLYDYCMRGGKWIDNPDYIPNLPEYDGAWKNWNPEKIWIPDKGLGMAFVFDTINEIYGEGFIEY